MEFQLIIFAVLIGIWATFLTDIWNGILKKTFKIQSLNFCFLGRWILYMPSGKFMHDSIKSASARSFECITGWIVHYSIGISLALLFIFIVPIDWLDKPTVMPAVIYGICTVVFPLFILQPSLGFGVASSKTQNPLQARLKSLMTHFIFGIGLWLSAIVIQLI